MSVPVLVRHDGGCRYARPSDGGHSDAAKRLSDGYNLHKAAGGTLGWIFAAKLSDGAISDELFPSKDIVVSHLWPYEDWFFYGKIGPASMSVCEAESRLKWEREAARLRTTGRDYKRGGLQVIPRLNAEDQARQMAALRGELNMPVALGYMEVA